MGKTFSLIHLWQQLLQSAQPGPLSPIPVFIPLNEWNQVAEAERKGFILNMICRHYGQAQISTDDSQTLHKTPLQAGADYGPALVLLLDGFNEITVEKKKLRIELNGLAEQSPGLQVVMTGRYDMPCRKKGWQYRRR